MVENSGNQDAMRQAAQEEQSNHFDYTACERAWEMDTLGPVAARSRWNIPIAIPLRLRAFA